MVQLGIGTSMDVIEFFFAFKYLDIHFEFNPGPSSVTGEGRRFVHYSDWLTTSVTAYYALLNKHVDVYYRQLFNFRSMLALGILCAKTGILASLNILLSNVI